jgi:phenylalanyl-tRNA synthetase beta chain
VFSRGPVGSEDRPVETVELALVTTRPLRDLRGAVEALCEHIAPASALELKGGAVAGLARDASAQILLDSAPAGAVGQVTGEVLDYYGLVRPIAAATIYLDALIRQADLRRTYRPVSRFPAVKRDLSLVVDEAVTWAEIMEVLSAVAQPLRSEVEYVATYRGRPIKKGRKSVTLRLTYQRHEGTLRSEQVDQEVAELTEAFKKFLGAKLRA